MSKGSRINTTEALEAVHELAEFMNGNYVLWTFAGSVRRECRDVGDIDIIFCGDPEPLRKFSGSNGDTKINFEYNGIQINAVNTDSGSYGAALMYLTGSKLFNIIMRSKAKRKGYLLNEYGLWKGKEKIAGGNEEEIFHALDMDWINPKDRDK